MDKAYMRKQIKTENLLSKCHEIAHYFQEVCLHPDDVEVKKDGATNFYSLWLCVAVQKLVVLLQQYLEPLILHESLLRKMKKSKPWLYLRAAYVKVWFFYFYLETDG